jgi:hypothetical protein
MPGGKPAGVVCVNLDPQTWRCRIWGTASYPPVCRQFNANADVCGSSRSEALVLIARLESLTGDG